jgi:hypothetical protein
MISVIICSANTEDLFLVKKNIAETIGVSHEIIAIENHNAKKGICEVYNEGTKKAKYNILCYMHEDIQIRTMGWGNTVLDIFSGNAAIGVLGIAGGGYKSLSPSGWYQFEFHSEERSYQNVLQGFKLDAKNEIHAYHNPKQEKLSSVVCVDGLWFCTRKCIALKYPFDSETLKGFHGYDIDFCLSVFQEYKIMVTYDILMKHASEGNFNKMWLNEILKLHRKWDKVLPLTTSDVSDREFYFTEKRCLKKLIEQMLRWDYSFYQIHRMILSTAKSRVRKKLYFKAYLHLLKLKLNIIPLPSKN